MLSQEELRKSPLFDGISYESYLAMCDCFHTVSRSFQPGDLIYDFSNGNAVGVVERGLALLRRTDEQGVCTVMEELESGSVFGQTLAFPGNCNDLLQVICRRPCDVLFIDYAHILKRCEKACKHHSILVQNMLRLMSDKARALTERIDVLSRRSIQEKLLCYFEQLSAKAGSCTFSLPFSLSTLAEYIAADRSAMMRELKRLREQKIISTKKREITLLSACVQAK